MDELKNFIIQEDLDRKKDITNNISQYIENFDEDLLVLGCEEDKEYCDENGEKHKYRTVKISYNGGPIVINNGN